MGFTKAAGYVGALAALCALTAFAVIFLFGKNTPAPAKEKPVETLLAERVQVIGRSVEKRAIEAYAFGMGKNKIVFVGGIHGGYEWNSAYLAYEIIDYLHAHPETVPPSLSVVVIPEANPDAVFAAVGKGGRFALSDVPAKDLSDERFNAHGVDVNRNFDCSWAPTGTWKNKKVSGGSSSFSEPEAQAIRDFALREKPLAVVFWHSAAGAVYASQCGKGILPKTLDIMNEYGKAAGYPAVREFTAYEVHGASEDWLASVGIPAVTVELSTHDSPEYEKNLAGVLALIQASSASE